MNTIWQEGCSSHHTYPKKNTLATPLVLLLDPIFNASFDLLTSVINSQCTCARAAVCVCVCVCVSVCVSVLTDIEDGFVLSFQTGIKARQLVLNVVLFENRS